jgi:hypothetical protein
MKAILAAILIAPCAATTFTPCPRPIDAPPIRLTVINTQTPGLECARRAATPIDAAILTMAAGCAMDGLIIIPMDGPAQALLLAGGKTPDEALGHEARHALQRWRHAPFMNNSEGACE